MCRMQWSTKGHLRYPVQQLIPKQYSRLWFAISNISFFRKKKNSVHTWQILTIPPLPTCIMREGEVLIKVVDPTQYYELHYNNATLVPLMSRLQSPKAQELAN